MLIVISFYLKFMYHRGFFRKDIFEKNVLCKKENNGIKHVNKRNIHYLKIF